MMKQTLCVAMIVVCSLLTNLQPAAAGDEFQEAIQQTEDEWQAVRGTLKEGQETLDDLLKNYEEYRDAAFSDAPEKGLELARMLFNLNETDTRGAEAKVRAMRDMFRELDRSGLSDKLKTTSEYLKKANGYAGEVQGMWEFTKKFNPDHAKDNPTYGLRLIGTLLSESAGKMESIPLVGQVLGEWVKAYGEVAGDFADALDRLSQKIDDFRGGSLCGQLGTRQGQQAAFQSAGGTDCLTHFATGIFPRLRGEAYEGESDYFFYDPATERGYISSKQADLVYQWHGRLLEPRALYPDWLAGRANSLQPETIAHAREVCGMFQGWADKSGPDWLVVEKLGLYQDAYFYGRLDEPGFMGNYILDEHHHKAINAILGEYEKYVVIAGTVREEVDDTERRASGADLEFNVGGATFFETTGADGRFEALLEAQVNDRVSVVVTKVGFETVTSDGRIPSKVVTGLGLLLESDGSAQAADTGADGGVGLDGENPGFNIGELVIEPGLESAYVGTRYAVGDPIRLRLDVTDAAVGPATPLTTEWQITLPDGRPATTGQSRLLAAEGVSGSMTYNIRTDERMPLGLYQVEAVISLRDDEVARRRGTFELLPLFEYPEFLITDAEENRESLELFRPADPLFVLARMNYNSVDPARQVHVSVVFEGPDPGIVELGVEADQTYDPGEMVTGVADWIPEMVQEGYYAATVTLDGGYGQRLSWQGTFRIIYPVQFEGIWTLNGIEPPEVKTRFTGNDSYQWRLRYNFPATRPGDQYQSALWCHYGEIVINEMSSEKMGPDTPFPGATNSTFTGVIPLDMPSGTYEVHGAVWYNGVAYPSPGTVFKVGREPTIIITSPQAGFMVAEKVLTVTGTCADEQLTQGWLQTNGESVPMKFKDGRFSARTVLRPGQNEIVVVAENEVGTSEDNVYGTADIRAAALKVVLSWQAQGTDVDLWVTDPEGVTTNYQHKRPAGGRQLDIDDQSGPGMETYTIEVGLRGQYEIAVHYYGKGGWEGVVPFDLSIATWEATFSERHSRQSGTLYEAGANKDIAGAVERFTVELY